MIAFSFRSITFRPPLATSRRFFISVELADGPSQNTEPFTYLPQSNLAALSETLEFIVKDTQKGDSFQLEILEFDERPQRWFKIGKETFHFNKLYSTEARDLTLPTIYGTDAVVDVNIELSDEFRESVLTDDDTALLNTTLNSLENLTLEQDIGSVPKKRSKRERLEKLFNLDRFSIIRNAPIYHELIFAITPFVDAQESLIDFFTWKDPLTTYAYSVFITLFIIYGRFFLGVGFLALSIFGKKMIPFVMRPRPRPSQVKGKLHIYKQNFGFMKELVKKLVYGYDIYRRAAEDPEKILFLQILFILKKFAPLLALVLFTIQLRVLLLCGYWTFLFYNTEKGQELFKRGFFQISKFLDKFNLIPLPQCLKVQQPITVPEEGHAKSPKSEASTQFTQFSRGELSASPQKKPQRLFHEKIFIIYENQRWWPGKAWRPELLPKERPSWSDALGQVELHKEDFSLPGPNWQWETDWNYVIGPKTDNEGWEYASRFKKFDDPDRKKSLIHGVRRRKWVRKCIGFYE